MGTNYSSRALSTKITQEGLRYSINKKSKTAKVVGYEQLKDDIIIPISIKHESIEYNVISISERSFKYAQNIKSVLFPADSELRTICEEAFFSSSIENIVIPSHVTQICKGAFSYCPKLKCVEIPPDSELRTIEVNAFSFSLIEKIKIPASLVELNKGWCNDTKKLTQIEIDPGNPRYSYFDDKFIIGKSSEISENYDILAFSRRDITSAVIPSFIRIIESYAFSDCGQLQRVEIPPDSELQTICKFAFAFSLIESIVIPSHVTQIHKNGFSLCYNLQIIEIAEKTNAKSFDPSSLVKPFNEDTIIMIPP